MVLLKIIRDGLIALLGGFYGAILGVYGSGNMEASIAWFLMFLFSMPIGVLVYVIEKFGIKKENIEKQRNSFWC